MCTVTVVRINAEDTHDESDKANVAQAVLNDATTDTANDTTQDVGAVLATVTVETPQGKQLKLGRCWSEVTGWGPQSLDRDYSGKVQVQIF